VSIGSISGLQVLNLFNNSLAGGIPSSMGKLKNLQKLDLRINKLNSTIPPELGLCTDLIYLALAVNSLSGELPSTLSNLKSMAELGLSDNKLSGELSSISSPTGPGWSHCNFKTNRFCGVIPQEIRHMTKLQLPFLYGNGFNGSIPLEIGNLIGPNQL